MDLFFLAAGGEAGVFTWLLDLEVSASRRLLFTGDAWEIRQMISQGDISMLKDLLFTWRGVRCLTFSLVQVQALFPTLKLHYNYNAWKEGDMCHRCPENHQISASTRDVYIGKTQTRQVYELNLLCTNLKTKLYEKIELKTKTIKKWRL